MVLPLSPSLWFEINTSTLKFIFNTHSFMFSICIWINKWQVQLLGGISYMTKYGHSCSSQHQESFSEHFSDENQTRIWDQRSEISMVMRDLRRNKNVNQKSLPMIRSFRKKPSQLIVCLISTLVKQSVLKPAYSCNQHQIHDQSSMNRNSINSNKVNMRLSCPHHFSRS